MSLRLAASLVGLSALAAACADKDDAEVQADVLDVGDDLAVDSGEGEGEGEGELVPVVALWPQDQYFLNRFDVFDLKLGRRGGYGEAGFPGVVLGPPGSSTETVSLGRGGSVTIELKHRVIENRDGVDFAVYENPLVHSGGVFAERAKVEVSQDGETWYAFDCAAGDVENNYPGCAGVGAVVTGGEIEDPLSYFGDWFDLDDLDLPAGQKLSLVKYIRITDLKTCSEGDATYPTCATPVMTGFDFNGLGIVSPRLGDEVVIEEPEPDPDPIDDPESQLKVELPDQAGTLELVERSEIVGVGQSLFIKGAEVCMLTNTNIQCFDQQGDATSVIPLELGLWDYGRAIALADGGLAMIRSSTAGMNGQDGSEQSVVFTDDQGMHPQVFNLMTDLETPHSRPSDIMQYRGAVLVLANNGNITPSNGAICFEKNSHLFVFDDPTGEIPPFVSRSLDGLINGSAFFVSPNQEEGDKLVVAAAGNVFCDDQDVGELRVLDAQTFDAKRSLEAPLGIGLSQGIRIDEIGRAFVTGFKPLGDPFLSLYDSAAVKQVQLTKDNEVLGFGFMSSVLPQGLGGLLHATQAFEQSTLYYVSPPVATGDPSTVESELVEIDSSDYATPSDVVRVDNRIFTLAIDFLTGRSQISVWEIQPSL